MKKVFAVLMIACICLLFCGAGMADNTFVTEGYESPGYENVMCNPNIGTSCWSEYTDGGSYVMNDSNCECGAPEKGNYCFEAYSDDTGNLAKITWKLDAVSQSNEVSLRVKLDDHNLANTDQIQFAVLTTDAGSKLVIVYYYYYNSKMYMAARYYNGGSISDSSLYEVNETDWNLVSFQYDLDRLRFKLKINHQTVFKDKELSDAWPTNPRKLDLGVCYNNGEGPATVLISSMEWDD